MPQPGDIDEIVEEIPANGFGVLVTTADGKPLPGVKVELVNQVGMPEEVTEETEEEPAEVTEQPDRLSFSETSKILWPVNGDVILNYSMDKSIYFSTLNQYKYHPAIVISAPVGSEVQCAARGKVSKIYVDEETGTTVLMQLGSGYDAVYGQLKEVAVEEGDIVEQGRLIGYVSEPTKYYSLEGSNLYFQLLKKSKPVDPMGFIE